MDDKLVKKVNFTFAELIDKLSICQIKEMLLSADWSGEIKKLAHDIDYVLDEKDIKLTPKLIRQIILMSQANLHIWSLKDEMELEDNHDIYTDKLILSQEFNNGIKNSIKNMISGSVGELTTPGAKATFISPDAWYLDIINNVRKNEI